LPRIRNYMTILAWIVLGLVAGFLASRIVNRRGQGIWVDLTLGTGGALVGGYVFTTLSGTPLTGLNTSSVLAATAGAVLVLFINHGIRRAFSDRLT
jgi:uncharacterized membrane protein YeaQ/YmgE (transglycosylase-associated protein family)